MSYDPNSMGAFDLNLGLDVVPDNDFSPAPENIYEIICMGIDVKPTRANEPMITLSFNFDFNSKIKKVSDNWVIPGADRRQNDPETWKKMMGMLRDRLEALTGREWRENNLKLDPYQDLPGNTCAAHIIISHETWEKDGEMKSGDFNKIKRYYATNQAPLFTPSMALGLLMPKTVGAASNNTSTQITTNPFSL